MQWRNALLTIAGAGVVGVAALALMGAGTSGSGGGTAATSGGAQATQSAASSAPIPPQLTNATGFSAIPGMQLVINSAVPLWAGPGKPPPFTASQLGLVGSLGQAWVPPTVVTQYGTAGHGLPLPLPKAFFDGHPGQVLEVFDQVLQFNNAQAPQTLLTSPYYNMSIQVNDGMEVQQLSSTIQGGLSYTWPGYNGETYYRWVWADGDFYRNVVVVGHNLPVQHAEAIAQAFEHSTTGTP